jgi:hypothetical protein
MKLKATLLYMMVVLFYTIHVASQTNSTPTEFGTTGETNTNPDDSAAPIDSVVGLLLISGIGYVFHKQYVISKSVK